MINPDLYYQKILADGRVISVIPLTFGRARLVVSPDVESNKIGYEDGW